MAAGAERRGKDSAMAAYLKSRGVTRETSQCPRGCGRPLRNGGVALLGHLNTCLGSKRIRLLAAQRGRAA